MALEQAGTPDGFATARRIAIHALAAPGANTDIFTALTPSNRCVAFRLQICLTTTSKVDVRVTDATTAYSQHLFANADCTAGNLYTCVFLAAASPTTNAPTKTLTYSIRVQTDSVIQTLLLDELIGPVS